MITKKMRRLIRDICKRREAEDQLQERVWLAEQVAAAAEEGQVAIVTSGMDCDCSAWSGRVSLVRATPMHVQVWLQRFYQDAEGPVSWNLMRPSEAAGVKQTSRDLALEAFEDGHPHVVHW